MDVSRMLGESATTTKYMNSILNYQLNDGSNLSEDGGWGWATYEGCYLESITDGYVLHYLSPLTTIASSSISSGNWHYAAITKDSGRTVKGWLDGSNQLTIRSEVTAPRDSHNNFVIGDKFKGAIDEAHVYNTALSTSTISARYVSSEPTSAFASEAGLQLSFTSLAQNGANSAWVGPLSVALADSDSNTQNTTSDLTINLSSSNGAAGTFSLTNGGVTISSITMASGTSSASFYYKDTAGGSPIITTTAASASSTTQTQTIAVPALAASTATGISKIGPRPPQTGAVPIKINNGELETSSRGVVLNFDAPDASWMAIGYNGNFSIAVWEAYKSSVNLMLLGENGEKNICVMFKTINEGVSQSFCANIKFVEKSIVKTPEEKPVAKEKTANEKKAPPVLPVAEASQALPAQNDSKGQAASKQAVQTGASSKGVGIENKTLQTAAEQNPAVVTEPSAPGKENIILQETPTIPALPKKISIWQAIINWFKGLFLR
jgi:hypothetical protein